MLFKEKKEHVIQRKKKNILYKEAHHNIRNIMQKPVSTEDKGELGKIHRFLPAFPEKNGVSMV